MKFDRSWVAHRAQCSEGLNWGLKYVEKGGKDLTEALPGFDRVDWLLWFMVKVGLLKIEMAFDLLYELCLERFSFNVTEHMIKVVRESTAEIRKDSVELANVEMTLGHFHLGHEITAVSFMARMIKRVREGDVDEALKDGQCVVNNLVAAYTGSLNFETENAKAEHRLLCDWLRSCVVVGPKV